MNLVFLKVIFIFGLSTIARAEDYQVLRFDYGKYINQEDNDYLEDIINKQFNSVEQPFTEILSNAELSHCTNSPDVYRDVLGTDQCFEKEGTYSERCRRSLFVLIPCLSNAQLIEPDKMAEIVSSIKNYYNQRTDLKKYQYKINYLKSVVQIWSELRKKNNEDRLAKLKKDVELTVGSRIQNGTMERDHLIDLKKIFKKYLEDLKSIRDDLGTFQTEYKNFISQNNVNVMFQELVNLETVFTDARSDQEAYKKIQSINQILVDSSLKVQSAQTEVTDLLTRAQNLKINFIWLQDQMKNRLLNHSSNQSLLEKIQSRVDNQNQFLVRLQSIEQDLLQYRKIMMSEYRKLTEKVDQSMQNWFKVLARDLTAEGLKDAIYLSQVAKYLATVKDLTDFLGTPLPDSGYLGMPLMAQRYNRVTELLQKYKPCDNSLVRRHPWMETGCLNLNQRLHDAQKWLNSLPVELDRYEMMLNLMGHELSSTSKELSQRVVDYDLTLQAIAKGETK